MSPLRLMGLFALAGLIPVTVAAGFAAAGAWLILPFAGLEVMVLAWAFVAHARHWDAQGARSEDQFVNTVRKR